MLLRSSVEKENANTPLGLNFWMTPYASIVIIRVDDHGLFAGRLKAGMHVEKVNDRFVGGPERGSITTVTDLRHYLAQLSGRVTIWVSDGKLQQMRQFGNECFWKARKSQQYAMMVDLPPPTLVEDSYRDYSDYEDDDLSSSFGKDCNMDEDFIEALLHRFSV